MWLPRQRFPEDSSLFLKDYTLIVSGGMKLVENWRFEIPFSSVGSSSRTSP